MARRKKGRKGRGKKSKAIALAPIMPVAFVALRDYRASNGLNEAFLERMVRDTTGYYIPTKTWEFDNVKGLLFGTLAGVAAHKIANKVGINRQLKKLTMGYIQF